ncbi:16130_t:CDS:1, partial [Gigaspora rosea]
SFRIDNSSLKLKMEYSENSTLFVALNYAFGITGTVICSFQLIPQ